jgi:hypothetical protein
METGRRHCLPVFLSCWSFLEFNWLKQPHVVHPTPIRLYFHSVLS